MFQSEGDGTMNAIPQAASPAPNIQGTAGTSKSVISPSDFIILNGRISRIERSLTNLENQMASTQNEINEMNQTNPNSNPSMASTQYQINEINRNITKLTRSMTELKALILLFNLNYFEN